MTIKTSFPLLGGAAFAAIAGVSTLGAQTVREGARTSLDQANITFGYVCDDRFIVRNDGKEPVRLEYGLDKNNERTSLDLDGRESVELLLSTSDQLNLLMNGQVIATARREYRDCDDEDRPPVIVRRPSVVIRPTVIVASYHRYYDPWYPRHVYFAPVPRPRTVINIPIVINRSRDRGRDYDRGRNDNRGRSDNRGRDNGRRGR